MENYEPNDFVYVQDIGFCQLVNCGRHKTLKLRKTEDGLQAPPAQPVLRKQKQSISFEPDAYMMFGEPPNPSVGEGEPESSAPQEQVQETKKLDPTASTSQQKEQGGTQPKEPVLDDGPPNIVSLKLAKTSVLVFTPDTNLSKSIRLLVKTFFGSRQEIEVILSISSTVLQLKNRIIELSKEPPANIDNPRLISCSNGLLVEYSNPKEFIYATKLRQNSKLLLLAAIKFTLDPANKGPSMNLTNSNRTVGKQNGEGGYELCFGNTTMHSGKHYFEAKIDKLSEEEDVIVGVARKQAKLVTANIAEEPIWGYICLGGRKLGLEADSAEHIKDYGFCCKVNDIVGTLIQFDAKGRFSLSFYVNGKFLGQAFTNLQGPVLPCIAFGTSPHMQLSLNTAAEIPFDLSSLN